jgi:hypothetical protein
VPFRQNAQAGAGFMLLLRHVRIALALNELDLIDDTPRHGFGDAHRGPASSGRSPVRQVGWPMAGGGPTWKAKNATRAEHRDRENQEQLAHCFAVHGFKKVRTIQDEAIRLLGLSGRAWTWQFASNVATPAVA